jgi:hypothetical protein
MSDERKPPGHLATAGTRFWAEVAESYGPDFEAYEWSLLNLAAGALDRGAQARRAIRRHGLTYLSPQGSPVIRPEIALEKASRVAFAQLVKQLGLGQVEAEPDEPVNQPSGGRVRPYSVRRRRGEYKRSKGSE